MTAPSDTSDAELRAWAKENGIEGVPTSGKLSAAWREQITDAMTTTHTTLTPAPEEGQPWISDPDELAQFRDHLAAALEADLEALRPEPEYRTPYIPDPNWVSGQAYTA